MITANLTSFFSFFGTTTATATKTVMMMAMTATMMMGLRTRQLHKYAAMARAFEGHDIMLVFPSLNFSLLHYVVEFPDVALIIRIYVILH